MATRRSGWQQTALQSSGWCGKYSPQDLSERKHKQLLLEIAQHISNLDSPLHVYKVKSHIGVIGNEMADVGAKKAGEGHSDTEIGCGTHPHQDSYWPASTEQQTPATGPPAYRLLSNLTDHAKAVCREKHKLGAANRETIYGKAWAQIVPEACSKLSNKFWKSTKITTKERTHHGDASKEWRALHAKTSVYV